MTANQPEELRRIYGARFEKNLNYRRRVWDVLVREFFRNMFLPPPPSWIWAAVTGSLSIPSAVDENWRWT